MSADWLTDAIALEAKYDEGYEAGKQAAYDELIELFKDIPMWGAVAAYKIEKLRNTQGES